MTASIARLPSRPARPTIEIDGEGVPRLEAALLSYRLHDSIETMACAELEFGNWGGDEAGFQFFGRDIIDFGKTLTISMLDEKLFEGRITGIEACYPEGASPKISVMVEDKLQDLRMTRRSRTFSQATLEDVASAIAEDHGLTARVDVESATAPQISQLNQSDFAFLIDLARRFDAEVFVEDNDLYIVSSRGTPAVELSWSESLRSFEVSADLASQRSAVIASGWDVQAKQAVTHEATESELSPELGDDIGGAALLEESLERRTETLTHMIPTDLSEARSFANSAFRHKARSFVTGEGICETDPLIHVGAKLELGGLGDMFNGTYRAIEVTHLFDVTMGAVSEFRCDRPGIGRPS